MATSQEPTPPRTLAEVLATPGSFEFLDALTDLAVPPGTSVHPPPEPRPELRQMIVTLRALSLYAGNEGIWKFLMEDGAAHRLTRARVWLERIGATRARAYLEAVASVFPDGQIPTEDSARADLLMESGAVNAALGELDRVYEGSFEEMAECFRRHIRQHFELYRKELEDEQNRPV